MNRKLKLMQIVFLLTVVSLADRADDLKTKSGEIFKSYTITRREGSIVYVSHAGGVSRVPISDIPDLIAWPYVKPEVEDKVEKAKQAKTPDQVEHQLREIVRQYPASEEMIKEELVQIQKNKEIEKQIAAILSSGTMDDQLDKLRKLLKGHHIIGFK